MNVNLYPMQIFQILSFFPILVFFMIHVPVSLTAYLPTYLDNMARGVTSKDCFSMAKVIPRASFSRTALVAYKEQNITEEDNLVFNQYSIM